MTEPADEVTSCPRGHADTTRVFTAVAVGSGTRSGPARTATAPAAGGGCCGGGCCG